MSASSPRTRLRFGLLALPFGAVLLPMPFLYGLSFRLLGVPVALVWLFLCLPLTTLCLAWSSALLDRGHTQ